MGRMSASCGNPLTPTLSPDGGEGVGIPLTPALSPDGGEGVGIPLTPTLSPDGGEGMKPPHPGLLPRRLHESIPSTESASPPGAPFTRPTNGTGTTNVRRQSAYMARASDLRPGTGARNAIVHAFA